VQLTKTDASARIVYCVFSSCQDLPSPGAGTSPRTPLDIPWSPQEPLPLRPHRWQASSPPHRAGSPPPPPLARASRSPSPVLHALLPPTPRQAPPELSVAGAITPLGLPASGPHGPSLLTSSWGGASLGLGGPFASSLGGHQQGLGDAAAELPTSGFGLGASALTASGLPLGYSLNLPAAPSPGLSGSMGGPLPTDFFSRDSAQDLLGPYLSLGPPRGAAFLSTELAYSPYSLASAMAGEALFPQEMMANSSPFQGSPFQGRTSGVGLDSFRTAAEHDDGRAAVLGGDSRGGRGERGGGGRQEDAMTQTEDGEAAAAPCERQIVKEQWETGKVADGQGTAEAVAGEREVAQTDAAEGGGLAGGGSEGREAAQLEPLMEGQEENRPRGAHDDSRAAEQEGGQQGAPHTAAPCPVQGRFQQAFTDRSIQVASLDKNTAGAENDGFPLGPAAEGSEAAGGGSEQPRSPKEGSGEGVTPFLMELQPPPGEGLQLRRAPSPYSLRRSTLLRTRQAEGEQKKRGPAEGEAKGEQKDGQQGGGEGEAKGPAREVAGALHVPSPGGCASGGSRAPPEIAIVSCCVLAGTQNQARPRSTTSSREA
jgi:hypothetical protein